MLAESAKDQYAARLIALFSDGRVGAVDWSNTADSIVLNQSPSVVVRLELLVGAVAAAAAYPNRRVGSRQLVSARGGPGSRWSYVGLGERLTELSSDLRLTEEEFTDVAIRVVEQCPSPAILELILGFRVQLRTCYARHHRQPPLI